MAADSRLKNSIGCAILLGASLARAFYIPGFSINSYADGQSIPLLVNKAYSDNTEIQYAYSELPFVCAPSGKLREGTRLASGTSVSLNLGEIIRGDRILISDYDLRMGKDEPYRYLCNQTLNKADVLRTIDMIKDGYVAEWIVDNLPGATSFKSADNTRKYYAAGFKMGYEDTGAGPGPRRFFLNNHVTLVIRWHKAPGRAGDRGRKVVVGFEVYAKSIAAQGSESTSLPPIAPEEGGPGLELSLVRNSTNTTFPAHAPNSLDYTEIPVEDENATLLVPYTYSVYFREEPNIEWANRWNLFFENQEDNAKIHWLAIIISLVIAGLLSTVVAVILARTVRGDIRGIRDGGLEEGKQSIFSRAKAKMPFKEKDTLSGEAAFAVDGDDSDTETLDDTAGWKLVHGDVFRTPTLGYLLAAIVGSGMQLVVSAVGVVFLSCIGYLNPSYRGGFISVGFALFLFAGVFSGYFSSRIYKTFGGTLWKSNAVVTAALFPGLLFAIILSLNLFVWAQASSTALPLGTLLGVAFLWLIVQVPLVYVGSWYGFLRAGVYTHPIKATVIPRQIPQQTWVTRRVQTLLVTGLVPFAIIFIELLFVFQSLWLDKSGYYYVFGFLAVVSSILILAIMETTVIAVYMQLCAEDYHWWWYSFMVGGSSSVWIFAYCAYYYFRYLHITGVASTLLFFSYSFLACLAYGLLTGTIGFLTAYAFVRRIYGAIKVD